MRKAIWIVAIVALGWSLWWYAATSGLVGGIDRWLSERRAEGWQADARIGMGGYPLRLRAGLADLALADPDAGLAIATEALTISAPVWWPGDVTVMLDTRPIVVASPLGRSALRMQDGVMALELHPGTALELEALGWTAAAWSLENDAGTQAAADALQLTARQREGATYDLVAEARGFSPGDAARRAARLPDGFPRAFDSLRLRATVAFDRPWDRRALDQRRPQPRSIALHLAEARWGDLGFNLAADLSVDAEGLARGTISLQAENWRTLLDLAEGTGVLPALLRSQADTVLQALAQASGNPETIDVALDVRDGTVRIGFLPVARLPRLVLR